MSIIAAIFLILANSSLYAQSEIERLLAIQAAQIERLESIQKSVHVALDGQNVLIGELREENGNQARLIAELQSQLQANASVLNNVTSAISGLSGTVKEHAAALGNHGVSLHSIDGQLGKLSTRIDRKILYFDPEIGGDQNTGEVDRLANDWCTRSGYNGGVANHHARDLHRGVFCWN